MARLAALRAHIRHTILGTLRQNTMKRGVRQLTGVPVSSQLVGRQSESSEGRLLLSVHAAAIRRVANVPDDLPFSARPLAPQLAPER